MTEQPTHQDFAVAKSYSFRMLHIGMISDMANRLGISPSAVVQRAVEALYNQTNDEPAAEKTKANNA